MNRNSRVVVLALATVGLFVTGDARAQKGDTLTQVKSDGAIAPAAVDTAVHKKGMFGKLKGVAHNKVVQNVAKAAVCTAVPGGQYMVGAAEAAKNKSSIASGAAGAPSCVPGMAGAAGMGGVGGGKGALAGAAVGAVNGAGGNVPGVGSMAGMMNMPRGGGAAATAQSLAAMQTAMAQMSAASAAGAGAGEPVTEASGEQMKLSGAVADEIRKGKLTIRKIDWVRGGAMVSAPSTEGFMNLMQSAGQAMKAAGGTYRVDVYTDKKYADGEIAPLGTQRALVIVSLLQAGGQLGDVVTTGKMGKDKEQRVEIVKVK